MFSFGHFLIAPILIAAATPGVAAQSCPTSNTWPADASDGARYGRAVDIGTSFLAIGDYSANSHTGAVFLHEWDGSTWGDPQVLTGLATGESFGSVVELSDDWFAISAPDYINGAVDLYRYDSVNWNYKDTYETPAGYAQIHMSLSYPWLAVAELSDSGATMRVQMLQHDASSDTWPVIQTLATPAASGYNAFISLDQNLLAVGLPTADNSTNTNCGGVRTYENAGGVWWTTIGNSTAGEHEGRYGQNAKIDGTTQTIAFTQHGDYASDIFADSILTIEHYDGTIWTPEPISGTMPWDADGSQINDIALDGDDLVVVLWSYSEWTTHYLQRSAGTWYYQSEIAPDSAWTSRSKYTAAIHDGMIAMDGGTVDTERIVWAIPAEDCDRSGQSDACEILIPGTDENVDGVLDRCMCAGDLDFDSDRDGDDIIAFLGLWSGGTAAGDLDADGAVNVLDLLLMLTQWGDCP
jgi:hypothetical protein